MVRDYPPDALRSVRSTGSVHPVASPTPQGAGADPVLLLTTDDRVRAETLRLAAGAGCEVTVTADPDDVRRAWPTGRAVLVGHDMVVLVAGMGLPRRPGVHVVAGATPDARALRAALEVGVEGVLEPSDVARLAALLGDLAEREQRAGLVLGVVGGSGGVGASVLTVALAGVAGRRGTAVAVDLAPAGAGLELLSGHDARSGLSWTSLATARGRLSGRALRDSLGESPRGAAGHSVLGWGGDPERAMPPPGVVAETLAAARRGHDLVAVDAATPQVWQHCDALVLVVAASVHGVLAAGRTAARLPSGVPCGVVVRCGRATSWPQEVARALCLPVWGVLPHQRGLDDHLSAGLGPVPRRKGPLVRAASGVLHEAEASR